MSRRLTTADDVIDALGGTGKVAVLTGRPVQAVSNWRKRGFPAETFLVITGALLEIDCTAPSKLWSMMPTEARS